MLVPVLVLLGLLIVAVAAILCRFYLWHKIFPQKHKNHLYSKLEPKNDVTVQDTIKPSTNRCYKQVPISETGTPPFLFIEHPQNQHELHQINNNFSNVDNSDKILSPMYNIQPQPSPISKSPSYWKRGQSINGPSPRVSGSSGPLLSPYSDVSTSELFHFDDNQSARSSCSEYDENLSQKQQNVPKPGKLTKKMRKRFQSEPILNNNNTNNDINLTSSFRVDLNSKQANNKKSKRAKSSSSSLYSSASSGSTKTKLVTSIASANGQVQFSLYFEPSDKSLTLQLSQLSGIELRPESFIGILDAIDRGSTSKHNTYQSGNSNSDDNLFLLRNTDGSVELSGCQTAGYFLSVALLPKRNFTKETEIVVGDVSAVFNARFVINGHTLDALAGK